MQDHAKDRERILWVDSAKGICIILVVMMHTTLGIEKATGETSWLSLAIAWAKPFRMPDFFLLSGLFLSTRINLPWRQYLDRKVVYFFYFCFLWSTIQIALKWPSLVENPTFFKVIDFWFWSWIEPLGTLWFIYILALFFVITKLLKPIPWPVVLAAAAFLELSTHSTTYRIETGYTLIDEFCKRYVYFYSGYIFSEYVFSYMERIKKSSSLSIVSLFVLWAAFNTWCVMTQQAELPGYSLLTGAVGVFAVITVGYFMSTTSLFAWVRACGRYSLVIYLAFFLFMIAGRLIFIRFPIIDLGLACLLVTAFSVVGPLILHFFIRHTWLKFLFYRPEFFRLK